MGQVRIQHPIDAPAERVWSILADYANVDVFHPNVIGSHILPGSNQSGLGALRQCDLSDGKNHIRERVTDWQDGHSYTVEIYEGTMPLRTAQAKIGVERISEHRSRAFLHFDYVPRYGVFGRVMDALMLKSMMRRVGCNALLGLESYATQQIALPKNGSAAR